MQTELSDMLNDFYNSMLIKEKGISKYFNQKTLVDGISFDSKKEANRYKELKLREKAKEIKDIQIHPRFLIWQGFTDREGKKYQPINYEADFKYLEKKQVKGRMIWVEVVEDVKGMKTEIYKLKKKMFLSTYNQYQFREI